MLDDRKRGCYNTRLVFSVHIEIKEYSLYLHKISSSIGSNVLYFICMKYPHLHLILPLALEGLVQPYLKKTILSYCLLVSTRAGSGEMQQQSVVPETMFRLVKIMTDTIVIRGFYWELLSGRK